jgi:two-component sensor histidine kinase
MKRAFINFARVSFILPVLALYTGAAGQADSLSLTREIERANALLGEDFPAAMKSCLALNRLTAGADCAMCRQRSLLLLGKAYWMNGEYGKSVGLLKQGIKFAHRAGDTSRLANAINMIGLNFYYQGYYDSAIHYFQQAYSMYTQLEDNPGRARVLSNISLMYHRKGDYHKTVQYLLLGEELNDTLQNEPRLIGDFPGMENVFSDSLYFREEIADNLRALKVHLRTGNLHAATTSYVNLAVAHNQVKEYLTAARYYTKVCAIQQKLRLRPYWNDVALNYRQANMKDSCFYYHEKARQSFATATQLTILFTYELLGDAYFHFNQYDSALDNYTVALAMNVKCNNRITLAGLHRKLADVYQRLGKFEEAEVHIRQGITLAKEVSVTHQRSLLKTAAALYAQKGEYAKAHYFQRQYSNLADSLGKTETALILTRLLATYKTSKKERELKSLRIEKEKNDLILKNRTITLASVAGITLVSFAFIVVFARQRIKIKKKNGALDLANKEQERLIKEIHHRVKNNLQIISSLISLKATKVSQETSEVLYQLNGRIYSMGLIHEKLYQKNEFQQITLDTYLAELSRYILTSFQDEDSVDLNVLCDPLQVDVDLALTCGLIINELLTNSMKYGFINQKHRAIRLELKKSYNELTLLVCDNGEKTCALPQNLNGTFGLRFVDQLVKVKLKGNWSVEIRNGFYVFIKFPIPDSENV